MNLKTRRYTAAKIGNALPEKEFALLTKSDH